MTFLGNGIESDWMRWWTECSCFPPHLSFWKLCKLCSNSIPTLFLFLSLSCSLPPPPLSPPSPSSSPSSSPPPGDLTALQSLDVLTTEESVLVDVRSEAQKGAIGVPSLPRAYSKRIIAFP